MENVEIVNSKKIEEFDFDPKSLYVVADFDKTLTRGDSESTWGILSKADNMGEEYRQKRTALYEKYRPMEIDETLPHDIKSQKMDEWWKSHIGLFYEYGLKEEFIINAVKRKLLTYRDGAKKFLKRMYELDIPVIIVSAGIGNIIIEFLKEENDLYPNIHIISNTVEFENGVMKGLKGKTIHSLNKDVVHGDSDILKIINDRKNILLFGDLVADVKMIPEEKEEIALKFGFLDHKIDENLKYYKEAYDVVIKDEGSFDYVLDIIKL